MTIGAGSISDQLAVAVLVLETARPDHPEFVFEPGYVRVEIELILALFWLDILSRFDLARSEAVWELSIVSDQQAAPKDPPDANRQRETPIPLYLLYWLSRSPTTSRSARQREDIGRCRWASPALRCAEAGHLHEYFADLKSPAITAERDGKRIPLFRVGVVDQKISSRSKPAREVFAGGIWIIGEYGRSTCSHRHG